MSLSSPALVTCVGMVHEGLACLQQVSKTREPDRSKTPQSLARKSRNGLEGVVFTPMRIAAQVVQLAQLAKNRAASRITQSCLQLIEGGNFVPIKELLQGL